MVHKLTGAQLKSAGQTPHSSEQFGCFDSTRWATEAQGVTELHLAVVDGKVSAVSQMIEAGASVNALVYPPGIAVPFSPLTLAVSCLSTRSDRSSEYTAIIDALLFARADPTLGMTSMRVSFLNHCIISGLDVIAFRVWEQFLTVTQEPLLSPIHAAVMADRVEVLYRLLFDRADLNAVTSYLDGTRLDTALQIACRLGHFRCVKALLRWGADPNYVPEWDDDESEQTDTPLSLAVIGLKAANASGDSDRLAAFRETMRVLANFSAHSCTELEFSSEAADGPYLIDVLQKRAQLPSYKFDRVVCFLPDSRLGTHRALEVIFQEVVNGPDIPARCILRAFQRNPSPIVLGSLKKAAIFYDDLDVIGINPARWPECHLATVLVHEITHAVAAKVDRRHGDPDDPELADAFEADALLFHNQACLESTEIGRCNDRVIGEVLDLMPKASWGAETLARFTQRSVMEGWDEARMRHDWPRTYPRFEAFLQRVEAWTARNLQDHP